MEHVVFHPGPDGSPAFRRFGSLEDAVRFVEHLRNAEGVSEVSVHALAPVPVAFRAYYKVEVPADSAPVDPAPIDPAPIDSVPVNAPAPSEPVFEAVPEQPVGEQPVAEPVMAEPVMAEAQFADATVAAEQPSNGKRSLGFFAH